jgi:ssDNA-binding replication factor A large subunit
MPTKHKPVVEEKDQRTKSILSAMGNPNKPPISRSSRQRVNDLVPNQQIQRLELVVLRRYPRRLVNSPNYTGSLAAACGRDETGLVGIVLWGDQVKQVKAGDIIRIENGWCRSRNGEIIVSTGRNGTLEVIDR